jgi:hypothetical protein
MIETNALPELDPPRPRWLLRLSWVNWRQHRGALIGLAVFAGLMAGSMLIAGLKVHNLYDTGVRDGCVNPTIWTGPCRPLLSPFDVGWPLDYADEIGLLLLLFPIAAGVFLGAPLLAREYASGTSRFAWTQGTSRTQLTVTKIVLLGLAVLAVAALLGWLYQWSMQPIIALSDEQYDRWQPDLFTATPITEAAAAGLTFAVGVLAGVVTRHVVPAMVTTMVATIVVAELVFHRLHLWLLGLGLHQGVDQAMGANPNVGYSTNLFNLQEVSGGRWLDHVPSHLSAGQPVLAVPVRAGRRRGGAGRSAGRTGHLAGPAPGRVAAWPRLLAVGQEPRRQDSR